MDEFLSNVLFLIYGGHGWNNWVWQVLNSFGWSIGVDCCSLYCLKHIKTLFTYKRQLASHLWYKIIEPWRSCATFYFLPVNKPAKPVCKLKIKHVIILLLWDLLHFIHEIKEKLMTSSTLVYSPANEWMRLPRKKEVNYYPTILLFPCRKLTRENYWKHLPVRFLSWVGMEPVKGIKPKAKILWSRTPYHLRHQKQSSIEWR